MSSNPSTLSSFPPQIAASRRRAGKYDITDPAVENLVSASRPHGQQALAVPLSMERKDKLDSGSATSQHIGLGEARD